MISSQIYQAVVDGGYQTLNFFGTLIQLTPAPSENQPRFSERSSRLRRGGKCSPHAPWDQLDQAINAPWYPRSTPVISAPWKTSNVPGHNSLNGHYHLMILVLPWVEVGFIQHVLHAKNLVCLGMVRCAHTLGSSGIYFQDACLLALFLHLLTLGASLTGSKFLL